MSFFGVHPPEWEVPSRELTRIVMARLMKYFKFARRTYLLHFVTSPLIGIELCWRHSNRTSLF
jgi:hypothetical protein